jgi:hypothetical protein
MKKITLLLALLVSCTIGISQSLTTQQLARKFDGALSLYFYKNTLRMLNQSESKEFDDLIKDIEKMKFVMIDKADKLDGKAYKALTNEYKKESFEPVMTSRHQGRNFDIFVKDKKGSPLGTVVLVNDSTSLIVLDIIGTMDITKAYTLFNTIDNSTDIGNRIKNFVDKDKKKNKD